MLVKHVQVIIKNKILKSLVQIFKYEEKKKLFVFHFYLYKFNGKMFNKIYASVEKKNNSILILQRLTFNQNFFIMHCHLNNH